MATANNLHHVGIATLSSNNDNQAAWLRAAMQMLIGDGPISRAIDMLEAAWNGSSWRWSALVAGLALVAACIGLAALVSVFADGSFSALLSLMLLAGLLVLSMRGSGLLSGTSRRMSHGGLAREAATLEGDRRTPDEREADRERDRIAHDRKTIRMGIMALPLLVSLIYMLVR